MDSSKILPQISERFSVLRYLLMIGVVVLHNYLIVDGNVVTEITNEFSIEIQEPLWVSFIKKIANGFASASVPLFFLISAYLYGVSSDTYKMLLKKKSRSILVPYILWTTLYIGIYFLIPILPLASSFIHNLDAPGFPKNWNVWQFLEAYTGWFSERKLFVGQFWFLRDLLVMFLISPFLKWMLKKNAMFVLAMVSVLYLFAVSFFWMPQFSLVLFYFTWGLFFGLKNYAFEKVDRISYKILLAVFMGILVTRFVYPSVWILEQICAVIGVVLIYKFSGTILKSKKAAGYLMKLSPFAFFLFLTHEPIVLNTLRQISYKVIPMQGVGCLIQFVLPTFFCIVLCTATGILLNRFFPKVFRFLVGGRVKF